MAVGARPCGYRGFAELERDGLVLVRCHAGGCDQAKVIGALRQAGLWASSVRAARPVRQHHRFIHTRRVPLDNRARHAAAAAVELFGRAQPGNGTLVETYLRSRGICVPVPSDLRYIAAHTHRPCGTVWPAMIASVRDIDGRLQAVHRTWLATDGRAKAPVEPNKMSLGPVGGGAVRLAPAGERPAIAEGIETALSVLAATGIPTWGALSAGGMRQLNLPPLPVACTVIIAADGDPVGRAAACDAAERWVREGRSVRIAEAPAGQDFNNLLADERDGGMGS